TGMDSLLGISPKLDSMVSTGRLNQFTTSVLRTMATIEPGILLDRREKFKDISTVPAAMANAVQLTRWKFSASTTQFSTKSAGTSPIAKPRKSLICEEKMIKAMPLVKPTISG